MAAIDQLQVLLSGTEAWNKWRHDNPTVAPDLAGADLRGANLKGADLSAASLSEAELAKADLSDTKLCAADLSRATLEEADLSNADLENAVAKFANFRNAVMTRANLCMANLQGADLREASLEEAALGHTLLSNANLADAKQLDKCRFLAPVSTDFRTLVRSGHIPVAFLRGCGVPEELIENLPILFTKPIQAYSLFLQCADEDRPFVDRLYPDLQARGIRCWPLTAGAKEQSRNFEATQNRYFETGDSSRLLVISRHSAAAPWVEREARLFLRNERLHNRKLLFIARLEDVLLRWPDAPLESTVNSRAIDFRWWKDRSRYAKALDNLVASLSS